MAREREIINLSLGGEDGDEVYARPAVQKGDRRDAQRRRMELMEKRGKLLARCSRRWLTGKMEKRRSRRKSSLA